MKRLTCWRSAVLSIVTVLTLPVYAQAADYSFTTEAPDCCEIGDILQVEEHKLPTSYWYMLEHAYGASGNFKNRERLKTRSGKVVKKWSDERFKYLTLEFDE